MTGLNSMVCGETDAAGHVESASPFSAVFRRSGDHAEIVDLERYAVTTLRARAVPQSGERDHRAVLPLLIVDELSDRHEGQDVRGERIAQESKPSVV
jgi:hypothetical protein